MTRASRATSVRVRLFVYGSLKRGGRHHDVLQAAGATFLAEAETAPGYRLSALDETDEYLALERSTAGAPEVVQGELYEVPESQLPALDAFEGDAYIRGRLETVKLRAPNAVEESLAYFKKAR